MANPRDDLKTSQSHGHYWRLSCNVGHSTYCYTSSHLGEVEEEEQDQKAKSKSDISIMEEGLSAIRERAGEDIVVEKVENLERRLKAALHSEEYYEAHQVCRMLCSRLVGAQNEDKLLSLLKSTASTLRQAKELECAADLDALCAKISKKSEDKKPASSLVAVYRGKLVEAEDNMNCQMSDVTVTLRDGRTPTLDNVFVRGSSLRFVILPDMLKNAPMFKNIGRAQVEFSGVTCCTTDNGPKTGSCEELQAKLKELGWNCIVSKNNFDTKLETYVELLIMQKIENISGPIPMEDEGCLTGNSFIVGKIGGAEKNRKFFY